MAKQRAVPPEVPPFHHSMQELPAEISLLQLHQTAEAWRSSLQPLSFYLFFPAPGFV